MSHLEDALERQLKLCGVSGFVREHRFHATRHWRFDFAWPLDKLAVEVEGGVWANGRHTRGSGYSADVEKYNAAVLHGWRVLRFTASMIDDGSAERQIETALGLVRANDDKIPF